MNSTNITGRIGNVDLKHAKNGEPYLRLSVAVNEKWKDKDGKPQERTDWFSCTTWGKRATSLAKHVRKGMQCGVSGRMLSRTVEDESGQKRTLWELRIEGFDFLDAKRKDEGEPDSHTRDAQTGAADDIPCDIDGEDDIPF